MIEAKNGIFHLKNEVFSYLLRVGEHGELRHLHFGIPVSTDDADALTCASGLGWGASVLLDSADPESLSLIHI